MNAVPNKLHCRKLAWLVFPLAFSFIHACALPPTQQMTDVTEVKHRLNTLKVNNRISSMANKEFDDAYSAVSALEQADRHDPLAFEHLLWMAEHKTELADLVSRTNYLEYQRLTLRSLLDDLQRHFPEPMQEGVNIDNYVIDRKK